MMVRCPLPWQTGYDGLQCPMEQWDDGDVQQSHDATTLKDDDDDDDTTMLKDTVHDGTMTKTRGHQQCHPTLPVSQDQKSWHHNADLSRYTPSATTTSSLVPSLSGKSTSTRRAQIFSSTCSLPVPHLWNGVGLQDGLLLPALYHPCHLLSPVWGRQRIFIFLFFHTFLISPTHDPPSLHI